MKTLPTLVVVAALVMLGVGLLALPMVIRALPGRYASYLPEPLLALRHKDHPLTLPTPDTTTSVPLPTGTPPPTATASSTSTPLPTATTAPSVTPLPTATATPSPTPTPTPPAQVYLEGLRHERQGWNNCGPTTLAMALSYWGREERQTDIAPIVKPDPEDKHVDTDSMQAYLRDVGMESIVRAGGDLELLRTFLRAGYPVIVRTWYVRDARDQLGHYRLVIGYDDTAEMFDLYDSLYDPPTVMSYQEMRELWHVFNNTYMVVYPPDHADEVAALIGPDLDDMTMYQRALETARAELENPPATCVAYASCDDWVTFAWHNIGTNLLALGQPGEAAAAYDQARQLGLHYRMLWYQFGLYESYYAAGRYDDVITMANATLATAKNLEESYYWRGKARLAQGDVDGAMADYRTALRYHEGWAPAVAALAELDATP